MNYTIGELSKIMNVSIHTLRYYDNEGLLPFVQRKPNGQRIFTHRDLIFLNTIECLKSTGMPLKEIKQYIEWCIEGMPTVPQRYELFLERKAIVEEQIAQMQKILATINYKCDFYKKAIETASYFLLPVLALFHSKYIFRQRYKSMHKKTDIHSECLFFVKY